MGDGSPAGNTIAERAGASTLTMWALVRMNRRLLTAVVLLCSFLAFVALSQLNPGLVREIARTQNGLRYLFSSLVGGIITGTAIVVTLNQLVLAQELGAVGDQRDRMTAAMDFRRDVENAVDMGTSPPEPHLFLAGLLGGIETQATELERAAANEPDRQFKQQVTEYVEGLTDDIRQVKPALEQSQFGTFELVWNALKFNYSLKIYRARQIRDEHADDLSDATVESLDDTVEALSFFAPAREHFKTLYFQWELINLSRALLYSSVPALVVMAVMITAVDPSSVPGETLGVDNLVLLAGLGFTVGIAPFVVLTVYILRIVTVAKQTLAMGPFVLREAQSRERAE